jgi:MGT family glycosyltransferase
MARFLFAAWPFPGHVNPPLSIAKALQARGHEVAFYTGVAPRSKLEDEGVTVFPFRGFEEARLWDSIQAEEERVPVGRGSRRLLKVVFHDWLVGTIPAQVGDLRAIIRDWRPDVISTDPMMWGPILVLHETETVPIVVTSFLVGCAIPGPDAPPWGPGLPPPRSLRTRWLCRAATTAGKMLSAPMRREMNRVRAAYGLPATSGTLADLSARLPLYLVPSVPELDYNRRDLPPSVRYVGACVWNKPTGAPVPGWFSELPRDRPWVHVTEGTAHYQEPFVLRAAAQGLANLPMQVILTSGPQRALKSADLGSLAPNIRLERWVSHADLLPKCAALVTTGGAGTVMAALQLGVPMVIVPTGWDKPDNAQRVVEAGAGIRLAPRRCSPARLRDAVNRVIHEPRFRENALRIAERLAEQSGPPRAAELLESRVRVRDEPADGRECVEPALSFEKRG